MRAKTNPSEFVASNLSFIWERGYHSTGINDYAKNVGLPKGSFYNYFAGKTDFALQVVDAYAEAWERLVRRFLDDESYSVPERFDRFIAQQISEHCDTHRCVRGCLAGNLGLETANTEPSIARRIEEVFLRIEALFEESCVEAEEKNLLSPSLTPHGAATLLLNALEGAFLRMKVSRSRTPLAEVRTTLLPLLFRYP